MLGIPTLGLSRVWLAPLLVASTLLAGCTQPTDPADLSCTELGPFLVRDLERGWSEITDPERRPENEQEAIDVFIAQVRDGLAVERNRSCGNRSALRHSAVFGELLSERHELGLQPFVSAGFGAIDADLRALGEQARTPRPPYAPLPKPASGAIEGDMGRWRFTRLDAAIKNGRLIVSANLPIDPTAQHLMAIYFETKGSDEPDFMLTHPIGPSWLSL